MLIHRSTLLLCIVQISKKDLDKYYDYIYSEALLTRSPPPSLTCIRISERKAWKQINKLVYDGAPLKEALTEVRQDRLFWQCEVYERIQRKGKSTHLQCADQGRPRH